MAVDSEGRVYCAAVTGVQVFSPKGEYLGNIPVSRPPQNLAFAGADKKTLYIVGAPASLGSWDPNAAVALTQVDATTWTGTVTLPGSSTVEFKYIRRNPDNSVVWESDPNRSVATPSGGTVTFDDTWR